MTSKGSREARNKASPHHETSSHQYQGQTKLFSDGEHQLSNHNAAATNTSVQHNTQTSNSTPVPKASNQKPNFAVITTAEWIVHDKVQRWIEEGPGEQAWNSIEASSIEAKDQGRNGSGEQDTDWGKGC